MKNSFMASVAALTLVLAGILSVGAQAQTTEEGPGPSEQPSAPMEIGRPDYQSQASEMDSAENSGQPYSAQPGDDSQPAPSGEEPAKTDQGVGRISMIHGDVSTQRG